MSFSAVLEIGVGMLLVYYILSLISSSITSFIKRITQLDAEKLRQGLADLLEDPDMIEQIMAHPWVQMLKPKQLTLRGKVVEQDVNKIPPETFAKVLADLLAPGEQGQGTIEDIREAVEKLPEGPLRSNLFGMANTGVGHVERFYQNVEVWFNNAMAGASALYAQHTRRIVLVIALILTLGLNIDSIAIGETLYNAPTTRAVAAAAAGEILAQGELSEPDLEQIPELVESLKGLSIPLFWGRETIPHTTQAVLIKVAGLAITTVAAAQGSSFWYDVLKRFRA